VEVKVFDDKFSGLIVIVRRENIFLKTHPGYRMTIIVIHQIQITANIAAIL
jgi:hypothetical protein